MTDFERRLRDDLEPILGSPDPREKLSAYHDMPYALFRYDPEQEYPLRREVTLLQTRLAQKGKRVTRISLAECLHEAMSVNKRSKLTPPSLGKSTAWLADRRRDPVPINTPDAFSRLSQTFKFIQTAFGSVKFSIAAVPCSRPKPESRTPPHGNRTSV